MFQNSLDPNIESQIAAHFNSIKFSNKSSQKIFDQWKNDEMIPQSFSGLANSVGFATTFENSGIPPIDYGQSGMAQQHAEALNERIRLLEQLKEISRAMGTESEASAEVLLRKYTQTLPTYVKVLALIMLVLVMYFFWRAMSFE